MNTMSLAISGISIKQDSHGRFCLNDLHKAAGSENRHRPKYWTALQQTQDLISLLESEDCNYEGGIPPSKISPLETVTGKGKQQGTFVVKELVYAYAMWISAKFHIAVIRAYDALVNQQPKQPSTAPSTLTTEMERHVQEMVNALKHKTGKVHNTIYHELKTHFKVSTYTEIPIVKYAEVCAYFGEKPIYTAPELIQCDSRYFGDLERKAATLLELEQKNTAFVEISDEQVVIERQRFNELEFIAKCVTEPQSRFMSIMRRFDKTNLSDMATLLESMCHATPIKPKNG